MKKRALLIALLIALGGALLISPQPSTAQSGLPNEECHSVTTGDILTQTMGSGFDGTTYAGGFYGYETRTKFSLALPSERRISYISGEWETTGNSYGWPIAYYYEHEDSETAFGSNGYGGNSLNNWTAFAWTGPTQNLTGSWWLYFWAASPGGDDTIHLRNLQVCTVPPTGSEGAPEYSSDPTNNSTIDLGAVAVGETNTNASALSITNIGDSGSTLDIMGAVLTGTDAADFSVNTDMPVGLSAGNSLAISISCTPSSTDAKSATLTITSDDSDEQSVAYTLTCSGDGMSSSGWTRPIDAADQSTDTDGLAGLARAMSPFVELDASGAQSLVLDYSWVTGAPVHATRAGTVDSIQSLSGQCANSVWIRDPVTDTCPAVDEYGIGINLNLLPDFLRSMFPQSLPIIIVPQYHLYFNHAYLIKSTADDGAKIWYVVGAPKVKAGDELAAGCVLGETLPMRFSNLVDGGGEGHSHDSTEGWTIIQARTPDGDWFDIKDRMTEEPNGSACANVNSSCALVFNPMFANQADGWTLDPDETGAKPSPLPSGGVALVGLLRSRAMNLSASTQYVIEIRYKQYPFDPPFSFQVQLGSSTALTVTDTESREGELTYQSTAATYAADSSGTYSLVFSTPGVIDPRVVIDFVCISEAGAQPPAPSGGCIVLDPNLDQTLDTSPWTGSVAPDPPAFGAVGMIIVPDGGFIKQSITLHPKESASQDYKLWVEWRRQGIVQTDHNVSIDWAFDSASGTFGPATDQTWATNNDTFTVSSDTTADLTLTADGSHTTEAAQINRVCVTTADGELPPGYDPPPPNGDIACRVCAYGPVGDLVTDFSDYVGWLGCRLTQLWECQLKTVLYGIWTAIVDLLTLVAFIRIWLNAVIVGAIGWTNGNMLVLTRWLGGQFMNLSISIQNSLINLRSFTMITSGGAGFWDAIVSIANAIRSIVGDLIAGIGTPIIGLLQQIVSGLFGLIAGAMGIIGTLLTICFTWLTTQASMLINMLGGIINSLYSALNTAAVAIPPGAPDCTTPGTVLYYPCLGFYVLDNTIFSGPVMYIIPIFMGVMAFRLLLWGVSRIKATFIGG